MHITIIVNPAAGTAQAPELVVAAETRLREAGHQVTVEATAEAGDAERFASRAVQAGAGLVVAAGGDGTLNEIVNGMAAVAGGLEACALGVLPVGTGNDFARGVGVDGDPEAAVGRLLDGHERRVDLVQLDRRVFLNASAGGFTAETSAQVTSELKNAVGKVAYLIGGARALFEYAPVAVHIESGDYRVDTDMQLFAVCNGAYIGGGHQLAPTARPDDGRFEVCVVRASSTLEFLTLLPRLSSGDHVEDDDVIYFRAEEATLTFARPIKINTDGEVFEASRCHYRIRPGALRFMAPPAPATTGLPPR